MTVETGHAKDLLKEEWQPELGAQARDYQTWASVVAVGLRQGGAPRQAGAQSGQAAKHFWYLLVDSLNLGLPLLVDTCIVVREQVACWQTLSGTMLSLQEAKRQRVICRRAPCSTKGPSKASIVLKLEKAPRRILLSRLQPVAAIHCKSEPIYRREPCDGITVTTATCAPPRTAKTDVGNPISCSTFEGCPTRISLI